MQYPTLTQGSIVLVYVIAESSLARQDSVTYPEPTLFVLRTADETPPIFLQADIANKQNVGFYEVMLRFQMNEPGSIYYIILQNRRQLPKPSAGEIHQ